MIVGVFTKELGRIMAEALLQLHVQRAWIVHGAEGLDEISIQNETFVWEIHHGSSEIKEMRITPTDFGLPCHSLDLVKGENAQHNANLMKLLLQDDLKGPILDYCLLNTAALLYVAGKVSTLTQGVALARKSIQSGEVFKALESFALFTQKENH